ncbi:hypothetical protein ACHAWF_015464 [Thalassiosira exigua]
MPLDRSSTSSSRRLRIISLVAVAFFFFGLQFKNLVGLFGSLGGESDPTAGWAPDYTGFGEQEWEEVVSESESDDVVNDVNELSPGDVEKETHNRFQVNNGAIETGGQNARRERRRRNRERREQKMREREGGNHTKKVKKKKSRKYEASNYTVDFEPLPWTLPEPTPMRYQSSQEFMADYIAEKNRRNIALPWEQKKKYKNRPVTLPLPIISLNFPKSATLTMKSYFDCGGITAIHTSSQDGRLAVCMLENHMKDAPPLDGCNTHKLRKDVHDVVPIDFVSDIGIQGPPCYYASVHAGGLEQIAKHYPNATILLVTRNSTSWHRSMSKWGSILHRWKKFCGFDAQLHSGDNMDYWGDLWDSLSAQNYWATFYEAHTQKIREFAMKHLSMTYVEAELNAEMGDILEKYTGVSPSCVMDCHPGPKWVKQNNATGRCHPVGEHPALVKAKSEATEEQAKESDEESADNDDEEGNGDEIDDDDDENLNNDNDADGDEDADISGDEE